MSVLAEPGRLLRLANAGICTLFIKGFCSAVFVKYHRATTAPKQRPPAKTKIASTDTVTTTPVLGLSSDASFWVLSLVVTVAACTPHVQSQKRPGQPRAAMAQ